MGKTTMTVAEYKAMLAQQKKRKGAYTHTKKGKRSDLNDVFFRSGWEANFARYLNFLVKIEAIDRWEYEVDEYEFPVTRPRNKFYKPDFKVWKGEEFWYYEVKGRMDRDSKVLLKRMKRYYPNIKVILVDRPFYRDIEKRFSGFLPNWE